MLIIHKVNFSPATVHIEKLQLAHWNKQGATYHDFIPMTVLEKSYDRPTHFLIYEYIKIFQAKEGVKVPNFHNQINSVDWR